jgi:hypothetical protein
MKPLRRALAVLLFALAPAFAPAWAADTLMYAPLPPSKDLYSFADLYRLTVSAEWPVAAGAAAASFAPQAGSDLQIRTVAGDAPAPVQSAHVFSIASVRPPQGGLVLAFVGLAAALWVARRRLGYSIRG